MPSLIDVTGHRFGLLRAVSRGWTDSRGEAGWVCLCDCGRQRVVRGHCLRSGVTTSCGCVKKSRTHGQSSSPLYNVWHSMKVRCRAKYWERQHYYDRGITVCERWDSFETFYEDMGDRPTPQHSLDRIDVNKGYGPENCRWATPKEQALNRQNTRYIQMDGKNVPIAEAAARCGVSRGALQSRIGNGWASTRLLIPNQRPSRRSDRAAVRQNAVAVDLVNGFLSLPA